MLERFDPAVRDKMAKVVVKWLRLNTNRLPTYLKRNKQFSNDSVQRTSGIAFVVEMA